MWLVTYEAISFGRLGLERENTTSQGISCVGLISLLNSPCSDMNLARPESKETKRKHRGPR